MSKTAYHIRLKDYVEGSDFDRNAVDEILRVNDGKTINVLIDSLGGNLASGLSISTAFKHHGEVNVHFVRLNASASTIASLEHRTDDSDSFDVLYIGCEKFPFRDSFSISMSGVL